MLTTTVPKVLLGTLLLMLLCVVSGRPQVFSDTKAYYALGQEVAGVFTTPDPVAHDVALRGRVMPKAEAADQTRLAYTVAASRSPYWSFAFYLLVAAGTAWLVVAVQALIAAGTLHAAMRALEVEHAYLPVVAVLAVTSTLPLFVLFLMPDVFSGLAILAAAAVIARGRMLSRGTLAGLTLLMAAAALVHTSHILLLAGIGILSLTWALVRRRADMLRGAWLVLAAAAVGAVGGLAFPVTVQAVRGEPISAPPFLSARLIADGPGRRVLMQDCQGSVRWGWCRFTGQPLEDVNQILWATDPAHRVFQAANYDLRTRIIAEQPRFVLATLAREPGAVVLAALHNVVGLLGRYGSLEVLEDPTFRYRDPAFRVFGSIVPGTAACVSGVASCASRINIGVFDAVLGITLLAALVAIGWLLLRDADLRRRWGVPLGVVGLGLLVNAAVCGTLSGDSERYQSRITWLIPAMAMMLIVSRRASRPAENDVAHA